MRFFDSHNHLQDQRLLASVPDILQACTEEGVCKLAINGTSPNDWENVAQIAQSYPQQIIPNFGLHPWFLRDAGNDWEEQLRRYLEKFPAAGIGEIGLDRWVDGRDEAQQETIFRKQLALAVDYKRPVTIHCLKAWGWLLQTVQDMPELPRGFLLHSYSGSAEMLVDFNRLGARYSFSGYFAHKRKKKQAGVFAEIPLDRLLVETDAPDMLPPQELAPYSISDNNHPANLVAIAHWLANYHDERSEIVLQALYDNAENFFYE